MDLVSISKDLLENTRHLEPGDPVKFVYHPLDYAWKPHRMYLERFGTGRKQVVLVGMNPGPWGMGQTGVPFGAVEEVRDWMGLDEPVDSPPEEHPKRPIMGFDCHRNEVSGARLWGWARDTFGPPESFFEQFFVHNFCPLLLLEESGRNFTPNKLRKAERKKVIDPCNEALRQIVEVLDPEYVIGVGVWAEKCVKRALGKKSGRTIGRILHPSPASPLANKGWAERAVRGLEELGVPLPG